MRRHRTACSDQAVPHSVQSHAGPIVALHCAPAPSVSAGGPCTTHGSCCQSAAVVGQQMLHAAGNMFAPEPSLSVAHCVDCVYYVCKAQSNPSLVPFTAAVIGSPLDAASHGQAGAVGASPSRGLVSGGRGIAHMGRTGASSVLRLLLAGCVCAAAVRAAAGASVVGPRARIRLFAPTVEDGASSRGPWGPTPDPVGNVQRLADCLYNQARIRCDPVVGLAAVLCT